ncbi:putative glucuronosyltransferase, partial [Tetrabaena socialis]
PEQLAGMGFKPALRGPRIYIYELPPRYNMHKNLDKFDRPLYAHLYKRIISSGHRTLDGNEADFYYVPVDFRLAGRACGKGWVGGATLLLCRLPCRSLPPRRAVPTCSRYMYAEAMMVLRHIERTWPFWNATGGARHLLLSTSDLGGCEGKQLMRIRAFTDKSVWVTPWGLTRKHPRVWWPGCHRPGLDVVIPIPAQTNGMLLTPLNPKIAQQERNTTFYFAGKICGDNQDPNEDTSVRPICQTTVNPLYSAGMRQEVYFQHSKRPGYKIVSRSKSYVQDMSTSRFCLAPTGGGHGKRQVLVARFGCIPVPITDYVLQPYEPELDWPAFSVTVKEEDVPHMHTTLAAINDTKLLQMQKALACASKHLWWSTLWGGLFGEDGRYDAFATLMEVLRVRALHPEARPEQYRAVDERFRRFADCELDDEPPTKAHLCTYGYDIGLEQHAPTPYCKWQKYGKYGIPGGAICEGAPNIAQCARPWE